MIWPFSRKGKTAHLGIDIGTTSIKMVKIEKYSGGAANGKSPRGKLINYGTLRAHALLRSSTADVIQTKRLTLLESEVVKMIQALRQRLGDDSKEVIMSIPAFSSFVDELTLPKMPEEEIPKAVEFEARSHVPVPINEIELTWQAAGEDAGRSVITLVAVPKEILFRYRNICNQLGLTLKALEVETFSIIRALNLYDEEPVMILDIGAKNTNISIVSKGFLRASHNIDTSGRDLSKVISQGLGIPLDRAEQVKHEQGLLVAGTESISDLLYPVVDNILEEAKRTAQEKGALGSLKRVVLTGGSASLKGLPEYMQKKFQIPIDIANPWATIEYDKRLENKLKNDMSSLTVAVGLALY